MKKTLKLMVALICLTILAFGNVSCETKAQKEAKAKAEAIEKQTVEQLKTTDGLREYLKGRTFVYCYSPDYVWVKLTFIDTDMVVRYEAWSRNRSWGNSESFTYQVREKTDDYGKRIGYYIQLEHGFYKYFTFSNTKRSLSVTPILAATVQMDIFNTIYLNEVAADYIPSQWKD